MRIRRTAMKNVKRLRKKLDVGKEARRRARQSAGLPPAERVILDKRLRPPKHKKKIVESELD
jgi:hypothetical protein